MKFSDLFAPKHTHSNPSVRREAVGRLDDQALLARIASTDPDFHVRQLALGRLHLPEMLAQVAMTATDAKIQEAALHRVDRPDLLASVAEKASPPSIRATAVRRLDDQVVLARLAKEAPDLQARAAAVEKLSAQDVLAEIVVREKEMPVRLAALRRLTDQALLVSLLKRGLGRNTELAIIVRIQDHSTLRELARQSPEPAIREAALASIGDAAFLQEAITAEKDFHPARMAWWKLKRTNPGPSCWSELATTAGNDRVRALCVAELSDEGLLERVVSYDPSWQVRRAAVNRIGNPVIQARVAYFDSDTNVRVAAIDRLTDPVKIAELLEDDTPALVRKAIAAKAADPALLKKLSQNDRDYDVRQAALGNPHLVDSEWVRELALNKPTETVIGKLEDQDLLWTIATTAREHYIRSAAASRLRDPRKIGEIAKKDQEKATGCYLVCNFIDDPEVLANVARQAEQPSVRKTAVGKLKDSAVLAQIARNDPSDDVRSEALCSPHLTDQAIFREILNSAAGITAAVPSFVARPYPLPAHRTAIARIEDPVLLACLADQHPEPQQRRAAVENSHLTDQAVIRRLASGDPDPLVRAAAVSRVEDQSLLLRIATTDSHPYVQATAARNLADQLTGQQILIGIATGAENYDARVYAVSLLKDGPALAQLARNEAQSGIREAAVRNPHLPVAVLAEVVRDETAVIGLRRTAVRQIKDPAVVLELLLAVHAKSGLDAHWAAELDQELWDRLQVLA